MKKGFVPILILLVVIVLAGVGYFGYKNYWPRQQTLVTLSPTPITYQSPVPSTTADPTANWKILNNKNGFSVKYPDSLNVLGVGIQVDETNALDIIISSKPGDSQDNSPALHINVSPKASTVFKDMTLSQISQANYDANQTNKNTFKQIVTSLQSTIFDGKPAYTYTILADGFSGKWSGWPVNASINNTEKLKVVESEDNGNYFIFVYSADDSTLATVLSTFRFAK